MYKHMNVYICIHVGMCMYKHISTRMCVHACTTLKLCACVHEHM